MNNRPVFNHSKFKDFPPHEYWRLVIDGSMQSDPYELGWLRYESREQGSVRALLQTYSAMLDTVIKQPLTVDLLKELHAKLLSTVLIEAHAERGEFRDTSAAFGTSKGLHGEATEAGWKWLFSKEPKTAKFSLVKGKSDYRSAEIDDEIIYIRPNLVGKKNVTQAVTQIIDQYYKDLKSIHETKFDSEELKKNAILKMIAQCIRDLELTHPFGDGNCRLFCIIVLNKLLLENDLSPTILYNPNYFDGHAIDEMVSEIEKGMLTFSQAKKNATELSTDDIIKKQMAQDYNHRFAPSARPLHSAIHLGIPDLVKAILKSKNEKEKETSRVMANEMDKHQKSPLMLAAAYGDAEMVKILLLIPDIKINLQDQNGYTALMWAAECGYPEVVDLLIAAGADTSCQSKLDTSLADIMTYAKPIQGDVEVKETPYLDKLSAYLQKIPYNTGQLFPLAEATARKDYSLLHELSEILLDTNTKVPNDLGKLIHLYSLLKQIESPFLAKSPLLHEVKAFLMNFDIKIAAIPDDSAKIKMSKNLKLENLSDLPHSSEIIAYTKSLMIAAHYAGSGCGSLTRFAKNMVDDNFFDTVENAAKYIVSRPELSSKYNYTGGSYLLNELKRNPSPEKMIRIELLNSTLVAKLKFDEIVELGKVFENNPEILLLIKDAVTGKNKLMNEQLASDQDKKKIFEELFDKKPAMQEPGTRPALK